MVVFVTARKAMVNMKDSPKENIARVMVWGVVAAQTENEAAAKRRRMSPSAMVPVDLSDKERRSARMVLSRKSHLECFMNHPIFDMCYQLFDFKNFHISFSVPILTGFLMYLTYLFISGVLALKFSSWESPFSPIIKSILGL